MKLCTKCGKAKELGEFSNNAATKDGKYAHCKQCQKIAHDVWVAESGRNRRLLQNFGISEDQYNDILSAQNGRCAICGNRPRTRNLAVDHDHKCCRGKKSCGKCVRGLLCTHCNKNLLGAAHDSTKILENALAYLKDPPAKGVLEYGEESITVNEDN